MDRRTPRVSSTAAHDLATDDSGAGHHGDGREVGVRRAQPAAVGKGHALVVRNTAGEGHHAGRGRTNRRARRSRDIDAPVSGVAANRGKRTDDHASRRSAQAVTRRHREMRSDDRHDEAEKHAGSSVPRRRSDRLPTRYDAEKGCHNWAERGRSAMTVEYRLEGPVAVITIDRFRRRNAVDSATAEALGAAWRRFEDDSEASVGVLHGANGVFSAGADLVAFDLEDQPDGFLGFTRMTVSKPTIAAISGYCVAGGLEMALWCDLRVAGADAVFGCFERRWGVPLVDGGTQRLPRLIGLSRAMDLILTGRAVDAAEALEIGLTNRVVPAGSDLSEAIALAARIAAFPQATLRSDRAAALDGLGQPLEEGLEIERRHGIEVLDVAATGAAVFTAGAGRHGSPVEAELE